MSDSNSPSRIERRKLETYARTLLDAARSEDRVYEDLVPLRAQADASPEVLSVMSAMANAGDLDHLPEVLELYREMVDGDRDIIGVHVTTAIPLDDELRDLIKNKCESDLESKVFLIEHVDPSIIGGVVLATSDHRRDASVRMQLESARKIMTRSKQNTEV
ncbi:MAG: F0F1 ATP synthase subunit delta [Coriobacteriaceae bacterium]|nr:F0F1 ATP synthase subunit delta [Coriobacteriaceae bacterium]